jgi:threonine dehydrogenase-like Zn-dependent dehydrogenase
VLTARFIGEGRIAFEEKVQPVPGPGEVLVKVAYCGLCGSEKPQYLGGYIHHQGHELSGEVVETGIRTKLAVGTKVVGYLTKYCGTCGPCSVGYTTACVLYKQKENLGWSWPGGFAEYVILPERNALPIGQEIDLENAVLLLDTLGTPFHGLRVIQAEGAQTACVIGCGTVGLGTILILKALGVKKVVASDFQPTGWRQLKAWEPSRLRLMKWTSQNL